MCFICLYRQAGLFSRFELKRPNSREERIRSDAWATVAKSYCLGTRVECLTGSRYRLLERLSNYLKFVLIHNVSGAFRLYDFDQYAVGKKDSADVVHS